jgi:hypothetical protein
MSNPRENKTTLTPIRLFRRPTCENNNIEQFNKTFTPLISNSFSHNKNADFSQNLNNTFFFNKSPKFHPMEFYALGKIPSGTVYPTLQWNKGIKSTSNNIIERNVLSINTKKFNQMYVYKNLASLYQQNVTENNYLKPVKMYKTSEKYNLPKNTTNFEIYKIMKEKYFSQDIQSSIAKGKFLNKTEFIKEKENLGKKSENKVNKVDEIKTYRNLENTNNDVKKDFKRKTSPDFCFKDPKDYSKKILKNNTYYFEQNNIQMMKPKKYKFEVKT